MAEDRRTNPRIDSPNLLSFTCLDHKQHIVIQGMGRTVNISEGGIMLETHIPIDPSLHICFTIALEEDLMDFKGKIIYSMKSDDVRFIYGIQFLEMNDVKIGFLKQYILFLKDRESAAPENGQGD